MGPALVSALFLFRVLFSALFLWVPLPALSYGPYSRPYLSGVGWPYLSGVGWPYLSGVGWPYLSGVSCTCDYGMHTIRAAGGI